MRLATILLWTNVFHSLYHCLYPVHLNICVCISFYPWFIISLIPAGFLVIDWGVLLYIPDVLYKVMIVVAGYTQLSKVCRYFDNSVMLKNLWLLEDENFTILCCHSSLTSCFKHLWLNICYMQGFAFILFACSQVSYLVTVLNECHLASNLSFLCWLLLLLVGFSAAQGWLYFMVFCFLKSLSLKHMMREWLFIIRYSYFSK